MILVTSLIAGSFFLESIISNFVGLDTVLLNPLFTLMAIIIIYPYFKDRELDYLKYCILVGFIYDIVFTDTLLLNAILFTIVGTVVIILGYVFSGNLLTTLLTALMVIILYRVIGYAILCLSGYLLYSFNHLLDSINSSILLNIIFISLLFWISDKLSKKYHIRKSK